MPSSLFADMERSGSGGGDTLDDQRALQIALDQLSLLGLDNDEGSIYDNEPRKKSVNMTECVPVPSSEHVAEIVGRQGESAALLLCQCWNVMLMGRQRECGLPAPALPLCQRRGMGCVRAWDGD